MMILMIMTQRGCHLENDDSGDEDHDSCDDNIDDYDDQDQNLVRTPGDGDGDDDIVDQDQDQDHVEKFPAACHLGNNDSGDVDGEDDKDRKKQNPLIFLPSAAAHRARCCPRFGNLPPWRS